MSTNKVIPKDIEELENEEWFYSPDYVLQQWGPDRVVELFVSFRYAHTKQAWNYLSPPTHRTSTPYPDPNKCRTQAIAKLNAL